jgi:hypothetical protein
VTNMPKTQKGNSMSTILMFAPEDKVRLHSGRAIGRVIRVLRSAGQARVRWEDDTVTTENLRDLSAVR